MTGDTVEHPHEEFVPAGIVRQSLASQYHAVLAMLRDVVTRCPHDLWETGDVPFWQVAYHTLYYADLYLRPTESDFHPCRFHQRYMQHLDGVPGPPELDDILEGPDPAPRRVAALTPADIREYLELVDDMVDHEVARADLTAATTGFSWHCPQRPRLEQHIDNIRHVQHHASLLRGRLIAAGADAGTWIGTKS
ncbi:MAG: hypothetical protein LLG24_00290 [Actinomycetia bacterium]|nr:hypothetical protein [Actinomycetes bacterium]